MILSGFLDWSAFVPKARKGKPAKWAKNLRLAMWHAPGWGLARGTRRHCTLAILRCQKRHGATRRGSCFLNQVRWTEGRKAVPRFARDDHVGASGSAWRRGTSTSGHLGRWFDSGAGGGYLWAAAVGFFFRREEKQWCECECWRWGWRGSAELRRRWGWRDVRGVRGRLLRLGRQ